MSKLGRYAADRKKVEAVTAAKTVEVSDCGTLFIVTGARTLTLPAATAAGKGWWIRIIKGDSGAAAVSITATSTLGGPAVDGDDVETLVNDCTIAAGATVGSFIEICSDGTRYYAFGMADHDSGITE
tara:strand:+ start:59 stop:439 length:381 start_codon:yes stop_codon:yes gene_type:complete